MHAVKLITQKPYLINITRASNPKFSNADLLSYVPGTTHDYEIMRVEGVHQHKGKKLSKETTRTILLNLYHQKNS